MFAARRASDAVQAKAPISKASLAANSPSLPERPQPRPSLLPILAAGLGAITGLATLGFIGWKFFHGGFYEPGKELKRVTAFSLAVNKPSAPPTLGKALLPRPGGGIAKDSSPPPLPGEPASPSMPQLLESLKASDPAERRQAASALHSLGPDAADAVPALRVALTDTDAEVRMWAALSLINNKSYDRGTIPVLVSVLEQDNPVLRQVACLSLGLIPYEEGEQQSVLPALAKTARNDSDDDVRKAATDALKLIAPEVVAKAAEK